MSDNSLLYQATFVNGIKYFGSLILLFITPIVPLILFVGFTVLVDTIFGLAVAKKNKKEISSNKLARIITKSLAYLLLILISYGLDLLIIGDILSHYFPIEMLFTKVMTGLAVFVEGHSIDEKLRKLNNNKGIQYYVKLLFRTIKSVIGSLKEIRDDLK